MGGGGSKDTAQGLLDTAHKATLFGPGSRVDLHATQQTPDWPHVQDLGNEPHMVPTPGPVLNMVPTPDWSGVLDLVCSREERHGTHSPFWEAGLKILLKEF